MTDASVAEPSSLAAGLDVGDRLTHSWDSQRHVAERATFATSEAALRRRFVPWRSGLHVTADAAAIDCANSLVEQVFAQIEECLGFRRFLRRGIEKVRSEQAAQVLVDGEDLRSHGAHAGVPREEGALRLGRSGGSFGAQDLVGNGLIPGERARDRDGEPQLAEIDRVAPRRTWKAARGSLTGGSIDGVW
jgi:hypothetical protein